MDQDKARFERGETFASTFAEVYAQQRGTRPPVGGDDHKVG